MRYSFRLAELLGHVPDPRRRPGTIKDIAEATGLDRHQVASLLKNEMKYIPLEALSRLCEFLVEKGYVSADQLPGALFAIETENFWELLARRSRLELCVGIRRELNESYVAGGWVVASDSVLLGEVLNGVSSLGGTAKYAKSGTQPPHPEHIRQSLVLSPGVDSREAVLKRASHVYQEFVDAPNDKSLVCLGSVKSNPVVELIFAEAFGCEPFTTQDTVARPEDRSCPFMMRYRDDDPHPHSCSAGRDLAQGVAAKAAGFYYEQKSGEWACCRWSDSMQDTALVFYIYRESQGRLEMVLSGFSGRATRLLSYTLNSSAEKFWPPVYKGHGIQIGAYLVQYRLAPQDDRSWDVLETEPPTDTRVIALDSEVIGRRIENNFNN